MQQVRSGKIVLLGGNIEFLRGYNYVSTALIPWFGIMSLGYSPGQAIPQSQNSAICRILLDLQFPGVVYRNALQAGNPVARNMRSQIVIPVYQPRNTITLLFHSTMFLDIFRGYCFHYSILNLPQ